jgi:uncharacterized alpha-E superfamily protein
MLVEDPWVDEARVCSSLMEVMGVPDGTAAGSQAQVLSALAYDANNPSSIAGALSAARENARGARETISAEIFEALNSTWIDLPEQRRRADRFGPHGFFAWVRESTAIMSGLVDSTMSRDESWTFLTLGRSLERADMTARLLMLRTLPGGRAPTWGTLLRSCGSYESYLRTYRGPVRETRAAEFLMIDRLSPRSVFSALSGAERCLQMLDPAAGRSGVADEARRLLGQARADLEFRTPGALLADFSADLEGLQSTCSMVNEAIAARYFPRIAQMTWTTGGGDPVTGVVAGAAS